MRRKLSNELNLLICRIFTLQLNSCSISIYSHIRTLPFIRGCINRSITACFIKRSQLKHSIKCYDEEINYRSNIPVDGATFSPV